MLKMDFSTSGLIGLYSFNTLQKMPFLNCVTVTQIMCKHGFLHAILRQNYIEILIRDDV